jgi:hypothetical protein
MTMIRHTAPIVKPAPRPKPQPRPFGEGLLEPCEPTGFVGLPASQWPAWTDSARWATTETIPDAFDDDELAPLEPPDEDAIPADVVAIRIIHGADQGEYKPVEGPQGREWSRLDGTYARIFEGAATRAYRAGRLAILSSVPPVPVKDLPPVWTAKDLRPAPGIERTHPDPADMMWWSGFALAAAGVDARPCSSWPADVQEAFRAGAVVGARDYDHAMDLEAERWELMSRASGHPHIEDAEWAEARMTPPVMA